MSSPLALYAAALLFAQQAGALQDTGGATAGEADPQTDLSDTLPQDTAAPAQPEAPTAAVPRPSIPDGMDIQLELTETLSSRTHVKGDLFKLKVTEDLLVRGVNVLPAGTTVIGEITRAETKAAFGVSGKLEAKLLYAELPDGPLRLRGTIGVRGDGGTFETVVTYAFIGTLAFVVTGKSAEIPAGAKLIGRTGNR